MHINILLYIESYIYTPIYPHILLHTYIFLYIPNEVQAQVGWDGPLAIPAHAVVARFR